PSTPAAKAGAATGTPMAPTMQMAAGASAGTWSAAQGFASPQAANRKPLDTWEKYAQMLLLANEMSFVD
ncbi:MAG: hypothetical protein ACKODH_06895, partial [Limisphaerales bacterium]